LCDDATFHEGIRQQLHGPADASSGGLATADGYQLGFGLPVDNRGRGRLFPDLAVEGWNLAVPYESAPDSGNGVQVHAQRLRDLVPRHPPIGAVPIAQQ
jgi:hypothetical protein